MKSIKSNPKKIKRLNQYSYYRNEEGYVEEANYGFYGWGAWWSNSGYQNFLNLVVTETDYAAMKKNKLIWSQKSSEYTYWCFFFARYFTTPRNNEIVYLFNWKEPGVWLKFIRWLEEDVDQLVRLMEIFLMWWSIRLTQVRD